MRGSEDDWRKESFDALGHTANLLADSPHASLFTDHISYLTLRAQGRRKEALAEAEKFVSTYRDDSFEIRQQICWHLIERTEAYWNRWPEVDNRLFPGNIGAKLFTPMFKEWRIREPGNINAWLYRLAWSFGLDVGEETAFTLEPNNPRCQYAELVPIIRDSDYALHEFSFIGYILCTPKEFADLMTSLTAVTDAMGENLHDGVRPLLTWLRALSRIYSTEGGGKDLRPILTAQSVEEPPDYPYSSAKHWFREPPDVVRG